jgi:LPS-assembly protein
MTIEPEQYLTARGVVFAVHDVPVLYLPYLVWPVKTERQTGLLQPHLAYSHSEGLKIRQPLFITLGPSQDMTLTLDERTKRGTGGVLEYRYRLSRQSSGEVTVDVFHDRVAGEGRVKGTLRRRLGTAQIVDFNERLQLRVWGQYVSDDTLLRDLTSTTSERTRRTIESNLFLTYHDAYQAITILTRYTRDLLQPDDTAVGSCPLWTIA